MSRSAFAARFTELVGEPVMQYVTRWRMQVALDRLQHDDVPIAELAARLGYESEAAFSRAFKRTVGISPGAARRSPPDSLPETAHLATACRVDATA
jgi:AraC-like DNA-binding protein